jgi:voltage-gated potassium channel Kch
MVARVLAIRKIPFTALDQDPKHIEFVSRFGNKVYFGDVTRLDLLRAAKTDKAKVFVLAIDDVDASVKTAELVRHEFPNVRIVARARNRVHAYRLFDLGVQIVHRETFTASLDTARDVLVAMGLPDGPSNDTVRIFREHDEKMLRDAAAHHQDMDKLIEIAAAGRQELNRLFEQDVR